uniref:Stretch regulated skeletal muscle protein n=1 Tax=Mus musculus TaxID=10090 RepID=Q9ER51_MOUSE|nr:stretch regulated skeletal muscle protein [Mus musculus]
MLRILDEKILMELNLLKMGLKISSLKYSVPARAAARAL